jgi:hypothetical protein
VGLRPLEQGTLDPLPVTIRQPGGAAPAARAGQGCAATLAPAGMPAAGGLAGDPKLAGDLGLGQALGEQAGGLQAGRRAALGLKERDVGGVDGVRFAMTIASHAKPANVTHSTSLCSAALASQPRYATANPRDRETLRGVRLDFLVLEVDTSVTELRTSPCNS